jgi:hypothetical protein
MASVMPHLAEQHVPVSGTKLLIHNPWVASESGNRFVTINGNKRCCWDPIR